MQYFKWMFDDTKVARRVPGFVFTSVDDAIDYSKDFEEWCCGDKPKNLYTFSGVEPLQIKQFLTSYFGYRAPAFPGIRTLSDKELTELIDYFSHKPPTYFSTRQGHDDIPKMLSIGTTVGCIRARNGVGNYVSCVEALYLWPVTMELIEPREVIATSLVS